MADPSGKGKIIAGAAIGLGVLGIFLLGGGTSKAATTCALPPDLQAAVNAAMGDKSVPADQLEQIALHVESFTGCSALAKKLRDEAAKRKKVINTECDVNNLPEPLRSDVIAALANPATTPDALDGIATVIETTLPGCAKAARTVRDEANRRRGASTSTIKKVMIVAGDTPVTIASKFGMTLDDFFAINPELKAGITNSNAPFNAPEFDADGHPVVGSYASTGMVDVLQNTPVWKRDRPNPITKLSYFIKSGGVLIPSSNNGPGTGLIFITGGKFHFVRPWAKGQTVNVRVSSGVSI